MKVLIVANYRQSRGGISGQVEMLHSSLRNDGVEADIFSTVGSPIQRMRMYFDLKRKAKDYDIIHVHCCSHFGFFPAVLALAVSKSMRKRIICTYHGGGAERFFKKFVWIAQPVLERMDCNIVLSGFLANIFKKYGVPYTIIPNILPSDDNHYREREIITPKFISVRTLQPLYNVECIIKAFATVKESIAAAELYVLGDGECRKVLEELVITLKLNDVHFVGRVPNAQVYDFLDRTDVFVSMPRIDNQPMSILEAFKCGLLVISSNVGGVPYMVENGKTGYLVPSDDSAALAKAMIEAVNNQKESLEIMRSGHAELDKYNWESIKSQLLSLYKKN